MVALSGPTGPLDKRRLCCVLLPNLTNKPCPLALITTGTVSLLLLPLPSKSSRPTSPATHSTLSAGARIRRSWLPLSLPTWRLASPMSAPHPTRPSTYRHSPRLSAACPSSTRRLPRASNNFNSFISTSSHQRFGVRWSASVSTLTCIGCASPAGTPPIHCSSSSRCSTSFARHSISSTSPSIGCPPEVTIYGPWERYISGKIFSPQSSKSCHSSKQPFLHLEKN
ncbi:hypothetical protein B0H10DRAFT_2301567, partial [Mycena sp. CBHHK59/15]